MKLKHSESIRTGRAGSALMVVLWTLGLLSLFVSAFAFDAQVEAQITSYYRKRTKADYLARSGVEMARMLMLKSSLISDDDTAEEGDRWFDMAKQLKDGANLKISEDLGDGSIQLTIKTEQSRRNVNLLKTEEEWADVLEVARIPDEYWEELVHSVLDWTDADDVERSDQGAESSYYEDLPGLPARAKNGPLDTVGELLLVRGFTRTFVDGGLLTSPSGGDPVNILGLRSLLTVYGGSKINVNAASTNVLLTLPFVDNLVVGYIQERRTGSEGEDRFFKTDEALFADVPELADERVRKYVTTKTENYYRIVSVGDVNGVKKTVGCVVRFEPSAKKLTILRWWEQDRQGSSDDWAG